MSSLAAWSYTSKATHWPRTTRDDWSRVAAFGAPVVFACDYSAQATKAVDELGEEFVTRAILHTERAGIKRGDRVMIGISSAADPLTVAEAFEVRTVQRYADTFDSVSEDFKVMT
jgi:hypothetical protein